MTWLERRVAALGVRFEASNLQSLGDLVAAKQAWGADLVVNCTGLGSGQIFGDGQVHGVIGDLVYVKAPGMEERLDFAHLSDEDHPGGLTYVIPQVGGVLAMAGTAVKVEEEGERARLIDGPEA